MKILHISDEHIRERDIDEIAVILNFIVETAKEEQPDLIVSAGDLFDSQDVRMGSRSAIAAVGFISALADIAPVAVIIGTPSHDGHAPEILKFAKGNCPIKVASVPEQIYFQGETFYNQGDPELSSAPEAIITLIPTPTKQFFQTTAGIETSDKEIGQAMSSLFAGFGAQAAAYPRVPHILATHLNVSGCRLANGQIRTGMDIEVSVDQMDMGNFDLGCLGHIHANQCLGEKYFYSGPIYSTKIDEDGPMGFWIHDLFEIPDEPIHSRFFETPCKRSVRIKDDYTAGGVGELRDGSDNVKGLHVRHEVSIWQDEVNGIDKAKIEQYFLGLGALSVDIRIIAVPRETIRAAAVLEAGTLKDEFREMSLLRGEEIDPEILVLAEKLENLPGEELLKEVAA